MRPMTLALGASLLTLAASPLAAQSMNAEVYHARAAALMKKGPLALLSRGEIKALMEEGRKAGEKSREQRLAALKHDAGRMDPDAFAAAYRAFLTEMQHTL